MATKASRIALAGSNISSTGEVDADLLDNIDSAAFLSLDGNGRLGIGTSSPISQLHVNKNVAGHNTDGITLGKVESAGWIDVNEEMGRLSWSASYGSSYTPGIGAYISAKADANWDGTETPTRLGFFTAPEGSTTPVERMRVNSLGNVGIGTSSMEGSAAAIKVEVESGSNYRPMRLRFTDDNNGSTNNPLSFEYKAGLEIENLYSGAAPSANGTKIAKLSLTTVTSSGYGATGSIFVTTNAGTGHNSGELAFAVGHNSSGLETEAMRINKDGNVGIGTADPSVPLEIVASSGANALRLRARSADDYAFIQFRNYAGTTLRGQIYSHQTTGSIGFTTGTDSSAGDDLYISNDNGVGINTTTTGGYNGRLTVYQDTHDAYTPTGFLDKPTMQLRHTANTDGYTGTRYANNTGTYEWFTGAHQFDGQRADFVTQGYDRDLNGYRENQRIHDTGQIVQPRQPSFMAHKTSHLALSGAGQVEAGSWSTTYLNGGHNVGGCFNTSTGRFTAPVAGRYKFDANIMHGRTSGDFQIWLSVNGNTSTCVKSNSMQSAGGAWKQTAVTGIFNLAASDYISIFVRSSTAETYAMYGTATAAFTTCNGYLIG
jgi:hypothetical protein